MSKIQKELSDVTEVTMKRNESRQDFLARLMVAVAALSDKDWESLTKAAQDWFNDSADAQNAKKSTLPDFPDIEPAGEDSSPRRRGTQEEPPKPKVGMVAKVTTKRGKEATGTIVELDAEVVVLKMGDGSEEEFSRDRVESIEVADTGAKPPEEADAGPDVDDEVVVVTKRGKEVAGTIVELTDTLLVLSVNGAEEEFSRDRIETIKMAKTKPAGKDPKPEPSARRGSSAEPAADGAKPKRASNGEVSIGTRIKELIADNLDASEADIAKVLKKEGLEFRENTLKLNYADAHKFIAILKARKLLKG